MCFAAVEEGSINVNHIKVDGVVQAYYLLADILPTSFINY
jgi:hypothetical protein